MGERIRSAGPATRRWPRRVRSSPRDGRRRSKRLLRRRPSPGRPPTGTSRANEPSWVLPTRRPRSNRCCPMTRRTMSPRGSTSSLRHTRGPSSTTSRSSEPCFDSHSKPIPRSDRSCRSGKDASIKWLEEALAPLQPQLPRSEVRRLAIAVRSATGIEALSWLTDVAGLSREDAAALMRWSAHAMLDATTAGPSGTRRKRSRGRPGAASSP